MFIFVPFAPTYAEPVKPSTHTHTFPASGKAASCAPCEGAMLVCRLLDQVILRRFSARTATLDVTVVTKTGY
jgi:hypothetical protein